MVESLPALTNPTPTAEKRIARWFEQLAQKAKRQRQESAPAEIVIPGLDVAAIQRQVDPAKAHYPQPQEGTFRVPLGMPVRQYELLRQQRIEAFITAMSKQGWEFMPEYRIQVYPGVYPARELDTNAPLLDQREMIVRAHFRFRSPQPVRIELPPEIVQPLTIAR